MQGSAANAPSGMPDNLRSVSNDEDDDSEQTLLQREGQVDSTGSEVSPQSETSPMYGSPLTVGNVTFSGEWPVLCSSELPQFYYFRLVYQANGLFIRIVVNSDFRWCFVLCLLTRRRHCGHPDARNLRAVDICRLYYQLACSLR